MNGILENQTNNKPYPKATHKHLLCTKRIQKSEHCLKWKFETKVSSIFSKMRSFIEKSILDAVLSIFKQFYFSQNSSYLGLDPQLLQRNSE